MRKLILLVVVALLVFMPKCNWLFDECYLDSDCDDDNPCTSEVCHREWTPSFSNDPSCLEAGGTSTYWCVYSKVDDGTPCEVDGQTGVCEAGECQLDDEPSEPVGDRGV